MRKQMERLLIGAAFAGMLALTGCGSTSDAAKDITAEEAAAYAEAAHGMLEEADGFAAVFSAEVQMRDSGKTVSEGTVMMAKEPLYLHVDMNLSFDDMEQKYDLYLEQDGEVVSQYMGYDGEWTEMTMTEDSALAGVQIYNTLYNMETIFSAAESWKAEMDGEYIRLTGVIPEEKFYAVEEYTRWFQLAGMSGLSEVYYAGVGDVPVTVMLDSKTGAPVSYTVDLAKPLEIMTNNVLTELGGGTLQNGVAVESYQITSELTQLGGVEVGEIPEEAKSDAINYEEEISLMSAE